MKYQKGVVKKNTFSNCTKILRINLAKEMEDSYTENYEILIKEIESDSKR